MVILGSIIKVALLEDIEINGMVFITIDKKADGKYYDSNSTRHAS